MRKLAPLLVTIAGFAGASFSMDRGPAPQRSHVRVHGVIDVANLPRDGKSDIVGSVRCVAAREGRALRHAITTGTVRADGSWSIEGIEVPRGTSDVRIISIRLASDRFQRELIAPIRLAAGADVEIQDRWADAPELSLRLLYADGSPVAADLDVVLHPLVAGRAHGDGLKTGRPWIRATTTARGNLSFGGVPGGSWVLAVGQELRWLAPGPFGGAAPFGDTNWSRPLMSQLQVTIDHGGCDVPAITLEGFAELRGRVVTARGEPSAHAPISLRVGEQVWRTAASCDALGQFVVHLAPQGCDIEVIAWWDFDDEERSSGIVTTRAGAKEIVLVYPAH